MSTISHGELARLVGPATDPTPKFFSYVSPRVSAKLPPAHPLNEGYSGKCRWDGKVSDHVLHSMLVANDMASCYAGGDVARLPLAGERVLLEVLPSCTCLTDISVLASVAGPANRYLNAATGTEASVINDFEAWKADNTTGLGPLAINPAVAPADVDQAAWPGMDIYIGQVNGKMTDLQDNTTFPAILAKPDGAPANPEICLIGDTGRVSEQWIMWAELAADVPANSYACVTVGINKGGRF